MGGGRFARKVDTNHPEIAYGIEVCGYPVFDCSGFGMGFPDLIVGSKAGTFILFEIKTPTKFRKKRHSLSESEWSFARLYADYPLYIIQTLDEALQILEAHHADDVYRGVDAQSGSPANDAT